jgi:hypothetical protein
LSCKRRKSQPQTKKQKGEKKTNKLLVLLSIASETGHDLRQVDPACRLEGFLVLDDSREGGAVVATGNVDRKVDGRDGDGEVDDLAPDLLRSLDGEWTLANGAVARLDIVLVLPDVELGPFGVRFEGEFNRFDRLLEVVLFLDLVDDLSGDLTSTVLAAGQVAARSRRPARSLAESRIAEGVDRVDGVVGVFDAKTGDERADIAGGDSLVRRT